MKHIQPCNIVGHEDTRISFKKFIKILLDDEDIRQLQCNNFLSARLSLHKTNFLYAWN